jgi:hypothetical protein
MIAKSSLIGNGCGESIIIKLKISANPKDPFGGRISLWLKNEKLQNKYGK